VRGGILVKSLSTPRPFQPSKLLNTKTSLEWGRANYELQESMKFGGEKVPSQVYRLSKGGLGVDRWNDIRDPRPGDVLRRRHHMSPH
jgi:hypothetical protein